ncbi:MAG TPA: CusA/CzcA family heavy metal efflux RND transporter [Isosphaeraceae bacterium]|jgi:cobalt-zinc-cadmium resistance protein CzcA|nr:CusA/CzcA family heavy metal efflux RND transporter [Isosphaeraceae bacterium]
MLNALIESSLRNRFLVIVGTLLVAGMGVYAALRLPIDAVPDLTNVQVQVITEAPALSPEEVETLLSFPVEGAMSGLPDVEQIRSISKFGISLVTIVFKEGTDIYRARQLVGERLGRAAEAIPPGYGTPMLGPIATALGEVYQFQVRGKGYTPMELRTILDWFVAYQLRGVPGVTEINPHGGELKTYQVELDPDRLANYGLTMGDIFRALRSNNADVGGGYIVREGEARYIHGLSRAHNVDDIAAMVIDERDGVPVTIANVARVHPAPMIRSGLVTRDGKGEVVTGLVMMLIGENSREVVNRVKDEIARIQKSLPEGVTIEPLYDRTHLISQTLHTVERNLMEGGVLVIVVLLVLLGNVRGGLIVALAIPLAMLFAANLMLAFGVTASLMSLGAIDFGLIVDSSVIMVENCVRRLAHEGGSRPKLDIVRDAAVEVRKPTMFGELIIAIVYLPILALQGTEGKLFRPMALTVIFALAGSMVLSLTLMPVLASLGLSSKAEEKELWLVRAVKHAYKPMLAAAVARPWAVVLGALAIVAASIPVALGLGGEFMPKLNEGDLLIEAVRVPSASLEGAVPASTQIEKLLLENFPEVRTVYCKTGRPEIANDVMGVHQTDVWTMLRPQSEWRTGRSREQLMNEMKELLKTRVPGVSFGMSQPIEMRVNELVAGVKSDVAALIYGDNLDLLARKAAEIERILSTIHGAADIRTPSTGRLPMLRISILRKQLAVYGIQASDVLDAVAALGGTTVGQLFEGQRRFAIQVRLPADWRNDPERIKSIRITDPKGRPIALSDLAEVKFEEGPSEVEREHIQRRAVVAVNVRGRDIASFVAEARQAIDKKVNLEGCVLRWGGQFEHLQTAINRLLIVVPVALLLIFLLLYSTFGSLRLAALIYLAVPMAATGGVFSLAARGLPFSVSAGVGFIALFGVAVLNGLVWVSAVEHLRLEGVEPHEAAREAAMVRLRPILMTALVAGLGFLPMAASTTPGAEIQRPLATVVIGGLITSTLLTTLVLPAIYPWFADKPKPVEL